MFTSTPCDQPRYTSSNDSVQITFKHVSYILLLQHIVYCCYKTKKLRNSFRCPHLYTPSGRKTRAGEREVANTFGVAFYLLISLNIATVGDILQYILSGANSLPERLVGRGVVAYG